MVNTNIDIPGLKNGNKKAFEVIYQDFFDMLFYLAVGYLQDRERARELVQDAFMKLWEHRETISNKTNIKNYLYTIVKNSCLNDLREQEIIARNNREYLIPELKYRQEALEAFAASYNEVESLLEIVEKSIDDLPEDIRITFRLNRYENLTYKEISQKLDISPKTVEARISKALKILRCDLKEYLPLVQLFFVFLRL
ncbi:RNA polymerase sigma-70 factor [Marinilabilia rubra]|uniref:RNA polymerase sigma-70 factor n=1 Tax=Marinilabilia rubra TaxID=2162893 RepID=A0A2U2B467_9BACT|nr:RNA polymerase sigma-70 factor [Marinilabilia rubra]PWD97860.1 RNA polymerase sigma-70 factor [Marinilabilia rubra]